MVLRAGTYRLASPLRLGADTSGRPGAPAIWRAQGRVVISGGRAVTGWHRARNGLWWASSHGLAVRQLYADGRRVTRASAPVPAGVRETASGFEADAPWPAVSRPELVFRTKWAEHRVVARRVAPDRVVVPEPFWTNAHVYASAPPGLPWRVEGARSVVTRPGSWTLDRGRRRIWYRPRPGADPRAQRLVTGRLPLLLDVRRAHDVRFEGLTFAETGWAGVESPSGLLDVQANFMLRGRNRTFEDPSDAWVPIPAAVRVRDSDRIAFSLDRFTRLGGAGLSVTDSSSAVSITRSRFEDLSAGAILLGGIADYRGPAVRGALVTDSVVRRAGVEYRGAVAIWAGFTHGTRIEHNLLMDLPYTAISIGWGWGERDVPGGPAGANVVRANRIARHMREMEDGAGIYTLGAQPRTRIERNVIGPQERYGAEIYLDEGSAGILVAHNALSDARGWPELLKGSNDVRDNYIGRKQWPDAVRRAAGPR